MAFYCIRDLDITENKGSASMDSISSSISFESVPYEELLT